MNTPLSARTVCQPTRKLRPQVRHRLLSTATGALVAVFCFSGCAPLPQEAVQQIRSGQRAYQAGDFATAEQALSGVIQAHAQKTGTAEALYLRSLCRIKTRRTAEGRHDLDRALKLARRKDLKSRIHAQLGNLDFDLHLYGEAAKHYRLAYAALPPRPPKDRIAYQYGLALQRSGCFAEARSVFHDLASQFPGSKHALLARSKADWPHDYFVIQCGAFKKIAGAHQHVKTLAQQRITALAVPEGVGSSRLYVVRVGRYPDYAAARQHLPAVRRVQPDAFIAP